MASEAVKKTSQEKGAAPPKSEAGESAGGPEEEGEPKGALVATKPAHHARRPMNAFLIFCKRHRTVVRKCYPNLENRAITKILGDWWSQLDNTEKESYIQLAQQYKEAFLKAFPDFKWYKLPAPPLRTLVTRPSNHSKPHKLECHVTCGPIVPGKLADESQMGRLSTLIVSSSSTTTTTASQSMAGSLPTSPTTCVTSLLTTISTPASLRTPAAQTCLTSPTVPKPPKKRYLQVLFDANCAGDQIPPDVGMEIQEVVSPVERHIPEWNGQQVTYGELLPTTTSSHCPDFTTLPLPALHSPQDDTSDHQPFPPQDNCCGDGPQSGSESAWSPNANHAVVGPELCEISATAATPYSSETTFHTSKQVIIDFVVDKLVNNEQCFQVHSDYVSSSSGADVTSKSCTGVSNQDGIFLSSGVQHCRVTDVLQFVSAPSIISLPPLRGVTGSFVPPRTTTRRDSVVNSFCSQPVSYVTAPSCGTEIVTWAQDINVSRIVASLTNNNVYIDKSKNVKLEVENLSGSPTADCGLADCIPTNASDHSFPLECPETLETGSAPFLINCKVYNAASLKSGCENTLISFTGYSAEDCLVSSGCDVSKTISYLPFPNEPRLPQSDLKFSSNSLEVFSCDDQDVKNCSVPVKIEPMDELENCPVTSEGDDKKNFTIASIDTLCTSSFGDQKPFQNSKTTSYSGEYNGEGKTPKAKSPNTNERTVVKVFSLKEHLKRYKAEMDSGDTVPGNDDSGQINTTIIDPSYHLLPASNTTKPSSKQTTISSHSTVEHISRVVDQTGNSCVSRVKTSPAAETLDVNIAAHSFKSSSACTNSKKSEDFANVAVKTQLLPQRQTSVRACKGQRYKQFMKETSRGGNKRARKVVLGNTEGVVTVSPKKEMQHQQVSNDSTAEELAETCKLPEVSSVVPPGFGAEVLPTNALSNVYAQPGVSAWHVASSQLPLQLVGSPRRERLDSASSCGSSERTFSACSEGSLDTLSSVLQPTCIVTASSVVSHRTSVSSCNSFSEALSPTEKRKRKFSESLLQQDLMVDAAIKKSCETFDFNLDEKIGALPPLSLEDFQIKKKNRKKRCFPILKTSTITAGLAPETATSHSATYAISTTPASSMQPVAWEATTLVPDTVRDGQTLLKHTDGSDMAAAEDLVGSQKRKARRNSIRRLDADRPADRMGADLWIGLLLLADAATSRSKIVVPNCSQETDVPVISHIHTSLT